MHSIYKNNVLQSIYLLKTCSLAPLVFAQPPVGHDLHDSGVYSIAFLIVVIVITHYVLQTQLTHVSSCSSFIMKQGICQYINSVRWSHFLRHYREPM